MGIWSGIKYALNSTLGTTGFKSLDKLIKDEINAAITKISPSVTGTEKIVYSNSTEVNLGDYSTSYMVTCVAKFIAPKSGRYSVKITGKSTSYSNTVNFSKLYSTLSNCYISELYATAINTDIGGLSYSSSNTTNTMYFGYDNTLYVNKSHSGSIASSDNNITFDIYCSEGEPVVIVGWVSSTRQYPVVGNVQISYYEEV